MVLDRQGLLGSALDLFVPIHRDGYKFVGGAAAVTVLLMVLWPSLAWLALIATAGLAFFFRDPPRVTPLREGLILAPADGKIINISRVRPPQELGFGDTPRMRVTIHLTMLDVHVNRAPMAGRVDRCVYVPGAFFNPALDKASEGNERRAMIITDEADVEIAVVQIAGVVCRRIVTFAGEGDVLLAGQRFGLIRFGSRVDVYLPPGKSALAAVGQRMVAGETILADLTSPEPPRDVRQS